MAISDATADELTLPQAALLAAFIGDRTTAVDPWCDPAGAAGNAAAASSSACATTSSID